MAIDRFVQPLLKLDIFQGLKPLQITEIARRAYRIIYKPGEIIIHEDEQSDAAVVIVNGEAIRIYGPSLKNEDVEPVLVGSILAEMAMLIEMKYTSTIVAKTNVFALRISREDMREQMRDDKAIAEHFIGRLTRRLNSVSNELRRIENSLEGEAIVTLTTAQKSEPASANAH